MILQTEDLKERLKVLSITAGRNPLKPLTQLIFLKGTFNKLTLMTTNLIDTVYTDLACEGELEIAVDVDLFCKLIASISTEKIELFVEDNLLTVIGKGRYTIPAVYSGTGEVIKFKDKRKSFMGTSLPNVFKEIHSKLKSSKADSLFPIECYKHFYFGEKVITSNTLQASFLNYHLFESKLYFESTLKILSLFDKTIRYEDTHFTDDIFYLITHENLNVDDYQYEDFLDLLNVSKFDTIDIENLKEIIDRFTLFKYENLQITNNEIRSEKGDIVEPFENSFNTSIYLDVKTFKKYVNTFKEDFEMYINEEYILLKNDTLAHIISKKII